MRLRAPGKLNLMLRIVGRRADGYHLLQSVFEPIDWCDEIRLRRRRDGRVIRRHGCTAFPAESDLTVRAALALQQASKCRMGVDLSVVKHLPMGAGLGGGSADAAAVLRGLNRLWRLHWPRERLSKVAAGLGADVAALLWQRPVWATGIGDQLSTLPLPRRHYVVIYPEVMAATPQMYSAAALKRDSEPMQAEQFDPDLHQDNAFEPIATALWPEIAAALGWLRERLPAARLTGSGSAVFAASPSRAAAVAIARTCPSNWRARACRSWREDVRDLLDR